MRIGIDAGGTFTDFVVFRDEGNLEHFKLRSVPSAPATVILEGIDRAAGRNKVEVVHGSTVATNALLERKGARTALVTTAGFEDVIEIGRQNREKLYDLNPPPRRGLVERDLRFGVAERMYFDGTVGAPPSGLDRLRRKVRAAQVEAIAVCLLHSYTNPAHEQQVAEALHGLGYLTASHEICPEFREYERTSTTVLNSYVGPKIDSYLAELERGTRARLYIMQSNGGFITAAEARKHAARTLLSGPAGGVVGAIRTAALSGYTRVMGFDMGGTSTDVSLADGGAVETMEASIDGFPIRVPILDIQTVGAGGGSIARVDAGGLLRVGPESAGADPGPACYGAGEVPTVTDAHVVLGRISARHFLGGSMPLYPERAQAAIRSLAHQLGLTPRAAAEGVLRVANANMERAIRRVSVERGYDPRDFALVAFGGCGGLHACEIANHLGIRCVIVPELAGVLSALGMLMADAVRDYSAGVLGMKDVRMVVKSLERRARMDLRGAKLRRSEDLRYRGQSYEITVPEGESFHDIHQRLYGYSDLSRPLEKTAVRVKATRQSPLIELRSEGKRMVVKGSKAERLGREKIAGPATVLDYGATTYIPKGWSGSLDARGNLICEVLR